MLFFFIDLHLTVEGMKVERIYESLSACVRYDRYHVFFFNYFSQRILVGSVLFWEKVRVRILIYRLFRFFIITIKYTRD